MDPLFKTLAKYGWMDIHYANAFLPTDNPIIDLPNTWSVGIRTGPNNDTICVKQCSNEEEVLKYKSPRGNSIKEAVHKSICSYEILVLGIKHAACRNKNMSGI